MANNDQIEKINKLIANHEERLSAIEKLLISKPEAVLKKMSIKEFMLSKNLKSEKEKTLAIAYYLEKYEGFLSFNTKDLENSFQSAKEPMPKNVNNNVNRNIKKGYLMESKDKKDDHKAWSLTNTGEKRVEDNFKEE